LTIVYLTIDTEYAFRLPGFGGPGTRAENFARSIACETPAGAVGVSHQMDVLDRYGLKGVFFVDPMPALLWGVDAIADVVRPIVARGHDVQLHCHTEWLEFDRAGRLATGRTGRNIKDFSLAQQRTILAWAREALIDAGAPPPVAFRAGNYGANDDTLLALAELGFRYDASHCPAMAGTGDCAISLGGEVQRPRVHHGAIEVPSACVGTFGGRLRHGQVTALSLSELLGAVRHARDEDDGTITFVSHSFELLSRDRERINRAVARRFERFCAGIAAMPGVRTGTFVSDPPLAEIGQAGSQPMPHRRLRSGARIAEQILSDILYNRSLSSGMH
jgi:hypothetical protein